MPMSYDKLHEDVIRWVGVGVDVASGPDMTAAVRTVAHADGTIEITDISFSDFYVTTPADAEPLWPDEMDELLRRLADSVSAEFDKNISNLFGGEPLHYGPTIEGEFRVVGAPALTDSRKK